MSGPERTARTPLMTVPQIIDWIDLEIADLQKLEQNGQPIDRRHFYGYTWRHLDVMKAQLMDASLALLDGNHGKGES